MQQHIAHASMFPLLSAEKQHALQTPTPALYQEMCIDFWCPSFILWISNAGGETQHWTDIPQEGNKGWQAGRQTYAWSCITSQACFTMPNLERNFRNSARFLDSCGGTGWIVRESLTTQQIQQHTAKTVAATSQRWSKWIRMSDTPHLNYV